MLDVARENATRAGLADRFSTLPGDAFEVDFGAGYDYVLITNFLHHYDQEACVRLLKKAHAAVVPGGCAVTVEFIPNEDRVSPSASAGFSLIMLATTPAGDAYPFSMWDRMLKEAGFSQNKLHPLAPTMFQVIISDKS